MYANLYANQLNFPQILQTFADVRKCTKIASTCMDASSERPPANASERYFSIWGLSGRSVGSNPVSPTREVAGERQFRRNPKPLNCVRTLVRQPVRPPG